MSASNPQTVLEVSGLKTHFHTQDGTVHAVNGVSFDLHQGELLAVVGESGSGKSVTMMSLLRLIPMPPGEIVGGTAEFADEDLLQLPPEELRKVRGGQIGFIFQDPMTSLNPVLTIGRQITEPLLLHTDLDKNGAKERATELLDMVGIPDAKARLKAYPHELSGGMRQRVMIAIALACSPEIIIADEPTTALDVTIQAQIVGIVKDLRERLDTAVIWITHDLGVVAGLADRVLVMYGGRIVEEAPVRDLYATPLHPYTQGLLASLPRLDQKGQELVSIPGQPPSMYAEPSACSFAPRCPHAFDRCFSEVPDLVEVRPGHRSACFWDVENERPRA
ncbi:MAG: ABC transporter ATP-binding protein [Acidimicrobiaceae bacterium]|jgi:oligopeptide transport system ATP-binding protein|nr:ABC transporter ATP-binding protein [Acidimicrobiaceae bacterium]MDB4205666.1 ABC transporter ATP-binding protein [bacterium]MDC1390271.1 ABC transporter ATP-binding protein [Acidimicrobiales bacterium]MCO4832498.1 ABC transporter ATP-binding protein [Acidimicrobiaceae bacterium]MDG1087155.1 ABC transporter ATP-binding protein [Acidimicrobiales bacterium]